MNRIAVSILLVGCPLVALRAQTVSQDYARYAAMLSQEKADQAAREQRSMSADASQVNRTSSSGASSSSGGSRSSSSSGGGGSESIGLIANTLNSMMDRHNAAVARRQAADDVARERAAEQNRARIQASDDFMEAWAKAHPLIQRNLEMAAAGDAKAMAEAGIQYVKGIGVPKNPARGLELLTGAATHGYALAARLLAMYYADGEPGFVAQDKVKSHEWTMAGAKLGDAGALTSACLEFMDGTGTTRNFAEADRTCTAAIEKGDATAANNLAYMYSGQVKGVPADRQKSIALYRKAIALGSVESIDNVINVLGGADGLPPDLPARIAFTKEYAEKGDLVSQIEMGIALYLGNGMEKNDSAAVHWLELAANRGSARAMAELASLVFDGEGTARDSVRGTKLLRQAAVQGWPPALRSMGIHMMNGDGVQQDQIEGDRLLRLATTLGDAQAPCTLGVISKLGIGVDKDLAEARRWFQLSIDRGNTECAEQLKKLPPAGARY